MDCCLQGFYFMSSFLKELPILLETPEAVHSLLKTLLEVVPDPFIVLSCEGDILGINRRALELLGDAPEALQQVSFADRISDEDQRRVREAFEKMQNESLLSLHFRLMNRSSETIPVAGWFFFHQDAFWIVLKDLRESLRMKEEEERLRQALMETIRERDQYAKELQVMRDLFRERTKEVEKMKEEAILLSYTDDLTGIYNHRFFIQQLTLEVERQKRYAAPLSLLMIDIDYFKHYNDHNGHLAGDEALKGIAHRIQHGVRQSDIVARYGGEEFVAILVNTGKEQAMEIAERVRKVVAETVFPNEKEQPNGDLTVSIGVATFGPPISTLTDLIRAADNALYRAKKAGRNRIEG